MNNTINISFSANAVKNGNRLPERFKGIAYKGDMIRNHVAGDTIIDLATIDVSHDVIVLFDHAHTNRIGKASLSIDGDYVRVNGRFSNTAKAMEIREEFADGMPFELSLGLIAVVEKPKEHVIVNNRIVKPDVVLRNGRVHELSLVTFGAASGTEIVAFAGDFRKAERELFQLLFSQVAGKGLTVGTTDGLVGKEKLLSESELIKMLFSQVAQTYTLGRL